MKRKHSFWADKDCSNKMNNPTEEDITNLLDSMIKELKDDWSKWGDVSEWARESMIRRLRKVKKMVKMPKRIIFRKEQSK